MNLNPNKLLLIVLLAIATTSAENNFLFSCKFEIAQPLVFFRTRHKINKNPISLAQNTKFSLRYSVPQK